MTSSHDLQNFDLPPVNDDNDNMPGLLSVDDHPIDDRSPDITPQEKQEPTRASNDNQTDELLPEPPINN